MCLFLCLFRLRAEAILAQNHVLHELIAQIMIVYLSFRPRNDRRGIEIGRRQTASLDIFQLSEKREMREKMELVIRNATMFSIRT